MKKSLKGVITVEMSYLVPIILLLFVLVIRTVFYYHDKNIILGAAAETAVLGAQLERKPDEQGRTDLAGFYQERISGKLILFSGSSAAVSKSGGRICVEAAAGSGRMRLRIVQRAAIVEPEKKIRQKRLIEGIVD